MARKQLDETTSRNGLDPMRRSLLVGGSLAATVAVFLASDAAAMVTGAEYEVTGGDSAKDI